MQALLLEQQDGKTLLINKEFCHALDPTETEHHRRERGRS